MGPGGIPKSDFPVLSQQQEATPKTPSATDLRTKQLRQQTLQNKLDRTNHHLAAARAEVQRLDALHATQSASLAEVAAEVRAIHAQAAGPAIAPHAAAVAFREHAEPIISWINSVITTHPCETIMPHVRKLESFVSTATPIPADDEDDMEDEPDTSHKEHFIATLQKVPDLPGFNSETLASLTTYINESVHESDLKARTRRPARISPYKPNTLITPHAHTWPFFANVTTYGRKARPFILQRPEPIVGIAETHLEAADFLPLAHSHYRKWPRCVIAPATPSTHGGTHGGVFMAASKAAKADPSATCVFSPQTSAHVSPHRDVIFYWASSNRRQFLVGTAYAREGNILRIAHALAKEIANARPGITIDFLIAADWNKPHQETTALFADVNIPAVAVLPDGPTCFTASASTTIDYVLASPNMAQRLQVRRHMHVPWSPHVGLTVHIDARLDLPIYHTLRKPTPLRTALNEHPSQIPLYTWSQASQKANHATTYPIHCYPGHAYLQHFTNHEQTTQHASDAYFRFVHTLEIYQLGRTTLQDYKDKAPFTGRALPPRLIKVVVGSPTPSQHTTLPTQIRQTHGPNPIPAQWATLGNTMRRLARICSWSTPFAESLMDTLTTLHHQWSTTPSLNFTGDHTHDDSDLGKAYATISALEQGWRTPWKTLLNAVTHCLPLYHSKPVTRKRASLIACQAKHACQVTERIHGLATPTSEMALALIDELSTIHSHILSLTNPPYSLNQSLTHIANKADTLPAQADTWTTATTHMSFYQWISRTLNSGKTGALHKWANAPNKPMDSHTESDPSQSAIHHANEWHQTWTTPQANPTDPLRPEWHPITDPPIYRLLNQLRAQILDHPNPTQRLQHFLDAITAPNIRKSLAQFNANTATGTDGLAITDLSDAPDEAIEEFAALLRDAVRNLLPPVQALFTQPAAVPKKLPHEKRAVGILTTFLRVLGRLYYTFYQHYDQCNTDPGDTAIKGGNLERATFERHAVAEATTRTRAHTVAVLWDLQDFFGSVKTYIAIQRTLHRHGDPVLILMAMWSHRAPRIVICQRAASHTVYHVPHSLLAGCTSSTSIARAVLPSLHELGTEPLPTHDENGTACYRHVDDIFQLSWGDSQKRTIVQAIRFATRLAQLLLDLQLTISDKTTVVAHCPAVATHVTATLRRLHIPAKHATGGLDCGVLFTGGGRPNKANQQDRVDKARRRAHRVAQACYHDRRAQLLATTGVQPMQAYGSAALGTPITNASHMRSNMAVAIYRGRAQPCPASLIHAQLGPRNDPALRIALAAIESWIYLWTNASPSTQRLLRSAWLQCLQDSNYQPDSLRPIGPITGTMHWLHYAQWKPALPELWTRASTIDDIQQARITTDVPNNQAIIKDFRTAITNTTWQNASHHHSGHGLQQGPPDFAPALKVSQHLRNLSEWPLASALDGALHGTAWPQTRMFPNDPTLQKCPRCGRTPETPWHRYWDCAHNHDIPDTHRYIAASAHLKHTFDTFPSRYPQCLWARAILPYNLTGAYITPHEFDIYHGPEPNQLTDKHLFHQYLHRRRWLQTRFKLPSPRGWRRCPYYRTP